MQSKRIKGGVCAPEGYQAHAVECGIKDVNVKRLDMGVIYSEFETVSAGVFTTNKVKAAAVKVCQEHVSAGDLRAFFANSGNANACTGERGIQGSRALAKSVADGLGLAATQIGICATGVIGLPLPLERMLSVVPVLTANLMGGDGGSDLFSKAILTSDTRKKEIAVEVAIGGKLVRIGGCAKGAGMIKPSMATMLCFLTTDLKVSQKSVLQEMLRESTDLSFNRISVDGDMSTNDTVLMMANGASGVELGEKGSPSYQIIQEALTEVMETLAKEIVLDGEKVTKFVTLKVINAYSEKDAKNVADAISNSPLVKSAWNGEDPNWGRVIHAVGYANAHVKEELVDISWEEECACRGGVLGPASIADLRAIATQNAFTLTVDLNLGEACYMLYTSDLSPEYIDYNRSEYSYWKAVERSQNA